MKKGISLDIAQLIKGNKEFRETYLKGINGFIEKLVIQGQNPKVMIIACSDSRVDPALIFNAEPGQLFVVRNVANLVPDTLNNHCNSLNAALEFGVCVLQVEHLVVLGHSLCGGIELLFKENFGKELSCIAKWMERVRKLCNIVLHDEINACAKLSIIQSLQNLHAIPFIQDRVTAQDFTLHGWYFDIATARIYAYDMVKNCWEMV